MEHAYKSQIETNAELEAGFIASANEDARLQWEKYGSMLGYHHSIETFKPVGHEIPVFDEDTGDYICFCLHGTNSGHQWIEIAGVRNGNNIRHRISGDSLSISDGIEAAEKLWFAAQ